MQATTRTQSGADVTPQVKVPSVTVYTGDGENQVLQIPTSHEEMNALLARRREISDQLNPATDLRNHLIQQLQTMPTAGTESGRSEIALLDKRIRQLEIDMGPEGRQVASASRQQITQAEQPLRGR